VSAASKFRIQSLNPVGAQGQNSTTLKTGGTGCARQCGVESDRQIVDRRQGAESCAKFIRGVANLCMEPNPQRPGQAQGPAGSTSQKQRHVLSLAPSALRRRHNGRVGEARSRNKRTNRSDFAAVGHRHSAIQPRTHTPTHTSPPSTPKPALR
jgi:hypothetical protein